MNHDTMDKALKGSLTARNGFKNEKEIAAKFNNWMNDAEAKHWLSIMRISLGLIESVKAQVLHGYKADLTVHIKVKGSDTLYIKNIQVKLVSISKGFNQVDKRWLHDYNKLWNIPKQVYTILQYFVGELKPYKSCTRDKRRMFLDEMTKDEQDAVINWFKLNKNQILADILKGRPPYCAEWVLVAQKNSSQPKWILKSIDEVIKHYSQGEVCISKRGSINLGKVGIQRKGGDHGRKTANMLQFKVDPNELFNL